MNYYNWFQELTEEIKKFLNKNNFNYSVILAASDYNKFTINIVNKENNQDGLIIDDTCFKKYYKAVMPDNYSWEQSMTDATKACCNLIKDWRRNKDK